MMADPTPRDLPWLERHALGIPTPPVRIVHLGLGAFHRAHEAWYTHAVNESADEQWGIAGFTGRRPDEARRLAPQDGLYTLMTRAADGDRTEIVTSIAAVHSRDDTDAWEAAFRSAATSIVSLTITEAGYCLDTDGHLDFELAEVKSDIASLRANEFDRLTTAPAMLANGLRSRRAVGLSGLTILSCDNLAGNGDMTRRVLLELCEAVDPELTTWINTHVRFPNTMVDRITPRTTEQDRREVAQLTGWQDASPVITEPFHEWVIEDHFAAGRPAWELAGARFVHDVAPYERRKLLLLNGAHSLLAYMGLVRGFETVDQAIADAYCRSLVDVWWTEASELVPLPHEAVADYTRSLEERWSNPRIAHRLEQIALDGSQKLPLRTFPVIRHFRESGRMPRAAVVTVGAWLTRIVTGPESLEGTDRTFGHLSQLPHADAVSVMLAAVAPDLAGDGAIREAIVGVLEELTA